MGKLKKRDEYSETFSHIAEVIEAARGRVLRAINTEMVACYWEIGRIITERIQKHQRRAGYGEELLKRLAKDLTARFGRGFSADNLNRMRQFYQTFPIFGAVRQELSWTHHRKLLTIEDETKRDFYMERAARERWSSRELERQMNSLLFERVAISNSAEKLIQKERALRGGSEKMELLGQFKDPYVLEFLNLADAYSERDLEAALLSNLQRFLLELGTDFTFLGRQVRVVVDGDDFYMDLLFYHRALRCLVAIDLKLVLLQLNFEEWDIYYVAFLEHGIW